MNIETLIAQANPVPPASLPSAQSPDGRRTLATVLAANAPARPASTSHSRTRRPRRTLAATGVAAAVSAAAVSAAILAAQPAHLPPRPHASTPAGTVAATLTALSAAAAAQPGGAGPLRTGQYWFASSVGISWFDRIATGGQYHYTYTCAGQTWVGWNGSGRSIESCRGLHFVTPHDHAVWVAAGRPSVSPPPSAPARFGPHQLPLAPVNPGVSLWTLPTDPARLATLLFSRKIEGGPPGAAEDWTQIGDLLRQVDEPPALRAALFKVALLIPGIRVLGMTQDHSGRTGVAIGFETRIRTGPFRGKLAGQEIIFDRSTSAVLGVQEFLGNDRDTSLPGLAWTDYLASGVVRSNTQIIQPAS